MTRIGSRSLTCLHELTELRQESVLQAIAIFRDDADRGDPPRGLPDSSRVQCFRRSLSGFVARAAVIGPEIDVGGNLQKFPRQRGPQLPTGPHQSLSEREARGTSGE